MTEQFDFDSNIDLEELLKQHQAYVAENAEMLAQKSKIQAQIQEISDQLQMLGREKLKIDQEYRSREVTARELEKNIEKARRLQSIKEQQAQLQAEFAEKAKELDELTKSAKWREFAFDHQIEGGKRLAIAKRGILGDKRGLGKTLSSLIYLDMVKAKRVLVLAPNDVVPQFEDEIRSWTSRTVFPLRGLPKSQRDMIYPMLNMVQEFIVTLNYEAWRKDKTIIDDLIAAGIDTIICDEAHRIKAADKVTARGVFQIAYRPNFCSKCNKVENFLGPWEQKVEKVRVTAGVFNPSNTETMQGTKLNDFYVGDKFWNCPTCSEGLDTTVKNVLCMTGTPILNKPQELFSMLFLVDKTRFPSQKKFISDYCYMYAPNRWRFVHGGLERLTKFMSQFFFARTRDDAGIHVPPPAITVHELEKDLVTYKKQYEAERLIHEQAEILLEDGTRKDIFFVLELILRERQCMTWPAGIQIKDPDTGKVLCNFDVEESQKLDAAMELLTELMEEEERVIVFSQFKGPLYEMHARMVKAGIKSVMATGDQNDYVKQSVREDFDLKTAPAGKIGATDGPRYQVCFATYKAFGTGINLNAARHMILLDDEWNPGMEDQAIGRIDRMNSVDQANVHIFRVKKSVDDFMAKLLEEKRKVVEGFSEASIEAEMRGYFS